MIKTSNINTGQPSFYHLRPASTFQVAGNQLTEDLRRHFRSQNRSITYAEAEAQKVSGTAWSELPFAKAWIAQVCGHVADYAHGIPDLRWLPLPKPLSIVVTGGSGLVHGLKEALKEAMQGALRSRRFDERTCEAVNVVDRYEPRYSFSTEAEIARRAVCFGAADSDKPGFRYVADFGPPIIRPTVVARRGWV
jgi:hypothetical protein